MIGEEEADIPRIRLAYEYKPELVDLAVVVGHTME
jgi:hypothetical protein